VNALMRDETNFRLADAAADIARDGDLKHNGDAATTHPIIMIISVFVVASFQELTAVRGDLARETDVGLDGRKLTIIAGDRCAHTYGIRTARRLRRRRFVVEFRLGMPLPVRWFLVMSAQERLTLF